MRQEEKIKAVELVKEWQKKRPNFTRKGIRMHEELQTIMQEE